MVPLDAEAAHQQNSSQSRTRPTAIHSESTPAPLSPSFQRVFTSSRLMYHSDNSCSGSSSFLFMLPSPGAPSRFFLLPNGSLAFVRILRESMHLPSVLPRRELTNLAAFLCSSLPTDTRTRRFGFFCSIGSRCPVARCSRHGDRYQGFRSGRCPEIHIRTQSAIRWPGAVLARGERRPRAPCAMRFVHVGGLLRTYSVKLKPGRSSPKG